MKNIAKIGCCLVVSAAAFGADAGLPAGWRELQYVTADGAQYLKTGFRLTADVWDYILDGAIMAAGYGGVNNYLEFESSRCGANGQRHVFHFTVNSDFTCSYSVDGGAAMARNGSRGSGSVIGFLALGQGEGFWSTASSSVQKGDIYSFVLMKNGDVVQHLVPAKDPDGVACLYDIQQNKPFYSEGSAAFVAGPPIIEYEIAPIPQQAQWEIGQAIKPELFITNRATRVRLVPNKDYTVAYENNMSSGTATALVSGIGDYEGENASVDFEIRTEYVAYTPLEYLTADGMQYFKSGFLLSDEGWEYVLDATIAKDGGYGGVNNYLEFSSNAYADGKRHEYNFTLDAEFNCTVYLDGDFYVKPKKGSRGDGYVIGVLALGDNGKLWSTAIQKGDVYSFVLKRGGELVMDLAPVKDENGVACFYDKVQKKLFYSEGSAAFAAGPVRSRLAVDPIPVQRLVGGGSAAPVPTVRRLGADTVLKEHEDYEVSYEDADHIGIATVRVTGKGNFAGDEVLAHFDVAAVFCVTADAQPSGRGLTWDDPIPFSNAVAAVSAVTDVPCEIWVAGEVDVPLAPEAQTWTAKSVSVLGGFAGTELAPEDRLPGIVSVLDGKNTASRILEFSNEGPVVIERLTFASTTSRALKKTGAGNLSVFSCQFVANVALKTTGTLDRSRACQLYGSSRSGCVFSNCVFSGNCVAGSGCNADGCVIYGETFREMAILDCLFVTNGVLATADVGAKTPGGMSFGSCIQVQDCPIYMRNSHFRGNRGRISSQGGGLVYIYQSCSGSLIENCSFAGSSDGYGGEDVAAATGDCGGAIVVRMRNSGDTITFNNCTIAYNLADAPLVPGGLDVLRGVVNVSNSVICANRRGKFGQVGADISVRDGGKLNLSYCHLTAGDPETGRPAASCVSETSEWLVTFDRLTFGDPKLKTRVSTFDGYIKTTDDYTYLDNSPSGVERISGIDVHERRGSPLVNAGDPASDYANEPEPNGHRINLGAYGNTPWAAFPSGMLLMVR